MKATLQPPVLKTTFRFQVTASSILRASPQTIAEKRKQPVVVGKEAMSASFLKHSDDQTVVAMWTVLGAVADAGWTDRCFADWGVVGAPNFFGRHIIARNIARFQQEGPWGVSPHGIPHASIHAISGTISQALKIHGPNFGVGGGANAATDAFLISAALLADGMLPGLWLVLTGHDAEALPTKEGRVVGEPECIALAMALTAEDKKSGHRLAVGVGASSNDSLAHLPELHLGLLADEWQRTVGAPRGRWRISDGHWIELETSPGDAEDGA